MSLKSFIVDVLIEFMAKVRGYESVTFQDLLEHEPTYIPTESEIAKARTDEEFRLELEDKVEESRPEPEAIDVHGTLIKVLAIQYDARNEQGDKITQPQVVGVVLTDEGEFRTMDLRELRKA